MTSLLHIRIDLSLPGASISHIAELLPINATECGTPNCGIGFSRQGDGSRNHHNDCWNAGS